MFFLWSSCAILLILDRPELEPGQRVSRAEPHDLVLVAALRQAVEHVHAVVLGDHLVRLAEVVERVVRAEHPPVQTVEAVRERLVQAHDVVELGADGGC